MGDYEKALEYYNKALNICEKVLGEKHPHTKIVYKSLSIIYSELGDMEKAREYILNSQ